MVTEAFEASKAAEAQTNATPASWSPPAEELIDPQTAVSGAPIESSAQQRAYGKSKAYSLILPSGWEETNDTTKFDFMAFNKSLVFEVAYFKESSKNESELLEILKTRLKNDGAAGFTKPFRKQINGINWIGFSSAFIYKDQLSGNHTCLIYKNHKGVFILMYGSALYPAKEIQAIFDPIVKSFKIE